MLLIAFRFLKRIHDFPSWNAKDKGKYQYYTCCDDRIILCTWMDSKQVIVYSNATQKLLALATVSKNTKTSRIVPYIIHLYHLFMGKVDQFNRKLGQYTTRSMSKKWWKPIFWYLLDCAIVNAWTMYNDNHTIAVSQKKFRFLLATALLNQTMLRKRRRYSTGSIVSCAPKHTLVKVSRALCTCKRGCKVKTYFVCATCPDFPHISSKCLSYHELAIRVDTQLVD